MKEIVLNVIPIMFCLRIIVLLLNNWLTFLITIRNAAHKNSNNYIYRVELDKIIILMYLFTFLLNLKNICIQIFINKLNFILNNISGMVTNILRLIHSVIIVGLIAKILHK